MQKENVFFAIMPDATTGRAILRRVAPTRRKYGFTGRAVPARRLHVSLHNLGCFEFPVQPDIIEAACQAAATFRFPAFDVTFDRALSFRRRDENPYVLTGSTGLETLRSFHAGLGKSLANKLGIHAARSFTPHLTLLYDAKLVPAHDIQPIGWKVEEFALIRSLLGRGRYEISGRWKLANQPRPS